jgi:hypothetical protein
LLGGRLRPSGLAAKGCHAPAAIRPGGYLSCITPAWVLPSKIICGVGLYMKTHHIHLLPKLL